MKKLLAGMFVFGFLFAGVQSVDASALSDTLLKIQSLTQELSKLRSSLKGTALANDPPVLSSVNINNVGWNSVSVDFAISSPIQINEFGFCYKKGTEEFYCLPFRSIFSLDVRSISIGNLTPSTSYTYYMYVSSTNGRTASTLGTFTTTAIPADAYEDTPLPAYSVPVVQIYTAAPPGLTSSTAAVGGHVTNLGTSGVIERGACYGTSSSFTCNLIPAYLVQGPNDMFATKFVGLNPDTTYYYRVYAKTANETVYSGVGTFKTPASSFAVSIFTDPSFNVNPGDSSTFPYTATSTIGGDLSCRLMSGSGAELVSYKPVTYSGYLPYTFSSTPGIYDFYVQCKSSANSTLTGNSQTVRVTVLGAAPVVPSVSVTNPTGGEFMMGVTIPLVFKTENWKAGDIASIYLIKKTTAYGSYGSPVFIGTKTIQTNTTQNLAVNIPANTDTSTGVKYMIAVAGSGSDISKATGSNTISNLAYSSPFTIAPLVNTTPSIKVLSPNGGDMYKTGDKITIKWETENIPLNSNMYVCIKNGSEECSLLSTKNTGQVVYDLNNYSKVNVPGSYFKAMVQLGATTPVVDYSDKPFTINSSSVTCPTNVPSVTCPAYETEAVKDADGCIIKFRCSSDLKRADILNGDDSDIVPITRTLKRGVMGDDVKRLQEYLGIDADGNFGRGTAAAVRVWQMKNGLKADGAFGSKSRAKAGL